MIFGKQHPWEIWHQKVIHYSFPPHLNTTLRSAKDSYFNNVIHTYFRIFRLSLNKTDYSCHSAFGILVTSLHYSKCWMWLPFVRTQLQNLLRHCSVASSPMLYWNSVRVSTSRCRNSTTSWIGARYIRSRITPQLQYNLLDLGHDCCLVRCQDWFITYLMFREKKHPLMFSIITPAFLGRFFYNFCIIVTRNENATISSYLIMH